MADGVIEKARGPLPQQRDDGCLTFSAEGFCGTDIYRAIAGRAKKRADSYCDFILSHCDTERPDFTSTGNLEMFVAWAAFACEVYLKSLIFHISANVFSVEKPDGDKKIKEHCLLELYEMLKSANNVGHSYAVRVGEDYSDFVEKIESVSKYFELYRYDFELDNERIDFAFTFGLMKKLRSITDRIEFLGNAEIARTSNGGILIS